VKVAEETVSKETLFSDDDAEGGEKAGKGE
jgi:hypothetical protein